MKIRNYCFPAANRAKITGNLNDYLLLFLSLIAIFGALIYYFYALNAVGLILTLILTVSSFIFLARRLIKKTGGDSPEDEIKKSIARYNYLNYLLPIAYVLAYLGLIAFLWSGRSDRALVSPWQVVNHSFFWLYGLASLLLIFTLLRRKINATVKIALLALHYFISFSVAVIVYKIGYGFDPFIHQATMELIAAKGAVLPKPPYYLGQYGLLIVIHKLSGLSLYWLNKILVPALTALFLPTAFYRFLKNKNGETAFLTVLFLLVLTFPFFIITTPQNLSYLFLILTILAGFRNNNPHRANFGSHNLLWVFLLALTTAVIHPLTGLPALGWAAWLLFEKYQNRLKNAWQKFIKIMIFLFTALALPLTLFLTGGKSFLKTSNWSFLRELTKNLFGHPGATGTENLVLNFTYFFIDNYRLFLILILAAALTYFYRRRQKKSELKKGLIYLSFALLIAYFLSAHINFNNLIDYEQNSYAGRILIIIAIFLLPFIITTFKSLLAKIRRAETVAQVIWLAFGIGLLTASLYASYPRFDKYFNSHGYSTSANDLNAVKEVAQNAGNNIDGDYVVLANQQVSVAALSVFGFDHYYQTPSGPLYFYPIPTGGPLYQYYLDMVYKNPDRETALKAMSLAGVNSAYLIVNKYWYKSGRVINEGKLAADKWWAVNNEVYVFRYGR